MNTIDAISNFLVIVIIIAVAAAVGVVLFIVVSSKNRKNNGENTSVKKNIQMPNAPREDVSKFLPFDRIEDDMIIQDQGGKFTMLLECKGINYYLMSEAERISVEEGFIQFLNSIRFPIQIYVQTRTVSLDDSIETYKKRFTDMQNDFVNKVETFKLLDKKGASEKELYGVAYQIDKLENVIGYTKDLIDNVENMTNNRAVLQKKYYIAVSYYVSEAGLINRYTESEMQALAFSELGTRCNSIAGALSASGIEADYLTSDELAEVMYIAINRDDSDIMSLERAVNSGFIRLYSTAVDPIIKKHELRKAETKPSI